MDKRVVWVVAGVAVIGTVVWLATRSGAPTAEAESLSATTTTVVTPESVNSATADSPAGSATATPTGVTPPSTASADVLPIDVSPGFEYLGKPASEMKDTDPLWSQWRRHQLLQRESRDESWAPRQEAALRKSIEDSLTAKGFDTQRIELPVVECRTHSCEIQAVGWSEDSRPGGFDLQTVMFTQLAENLGNEFERDGMSIMMSGRPDNRVIFLVHLPRKKP